MRRSNQFRPIGVFSAWLAVVVGTGCIDNTFTQQPIREIAVVTGDFDHMSEGLDRLLLSYTEYEGFICCAAYDSTVDPEANGLKTESLFAGSTEGAGREMFIYDAVFLNSGSRGWGAYEYNGVGEDNQLLSDPEVLQNIEEFVNKGNTLVLTDWTYDLVEAVWPETLEFYGDDTEVDAAQVGLLGTVSATVSDSVLATNLEQENVNVAFDFSNWSVIESVSEDVEVHLRGDVPYRISASEGTGILEDVPLLVSFEKGAGQVIFASFHWAAQTPELGEALMTEIVGGLKAGVQGGAL
jgi:hypothetical protein